MQERWRRTIHVHRPNNMKQDCGKQRRALNQMTDYQDKVAAKEVWWVSYAVRPQIREGSKLESKGIT
jgi:hypothetical protein